MSAYPTVSSGVWGSFGYYSSRCRGRLPRMMEYGSRQKVRDPRHIKTSCTQHPHRHPQQLQQFATVRSSRVFFSCFYILYSSLLQAQQHSGCTRRSLQDHPVLPISAYDCASDGSLEVEVQASEFASLSCSCKGGFVNILRLRLLRLLKLQKLLAIVGPSSGVPGASNSRSVHTSGTGAHVIKIASRGVRPDRQ